MLFFTALLHTFPNERRNCVLCMEPATNPEFTPNVSPSFVWVILPRDRGFGFIPRRVLEWERGLHVVVLSNPETFVAKSEDNVFRQSLGVRVLGVVQSQSKLPFLDPITTVLDCLLVLFLVGLCAELFVDRYGLLSKLGSQRILANRERLLVPSR